MQMKWILLIFFVSSLSVFNNTYAEKQINGNTVVSGNFPTVIQKQKTNVGQKVSSSSWYLNGGIRVCGTYLPRIHSGNNQVLYRGGTGLGNISLFIGGENKTSSFISSINLIVGGFANLSNYKNRVDYNKRILKLYGVKAGILFRIGKYFYTEAGIVKGYFSFDDYGKRNKYLFFGSYINESLAIQMKNVELLIGLDIFLAKDRQPQFYHIVGPKVALKINLNHPESPKRNEKKEVIGIVEKSVLERGINLIYPEPGSKINSTEITISAVVVDLTGVRKIAIKVNSALVGGIIEIPVDNGGGYPKEYSLKKRITLSEIGKNVIKIIYKNRYLETQEKEYIFYRK